MPQVADTVWFVAGSSGTADFTDGTALSGSRNLTDGSVSGKTYSYRAEHPSNDAIWENGYGLWDGITLVRTVISSSAGGTAKVNFAAAPVVLLTPMKRDWDALVHDDVVQTKTATQQAQARANVLSPGPEVAAALGKVTNPFFEISQENGTTAQAPANDAVAYAVDQFYQVKNGTVALSGQQIATPIASDGFRRLKNALRITATTASGAYGASNYSLPVQQPIEGKFFSDLGFGAADAQSIDVVLVLVSSVTGSQPIALRNGSMNRSYVTSVALTANTPKAVLVRIPGDTAGTWVNTTAAAAYLGIGAAGHSAFETPALDAWQAGNYFTHGSMTNWAGTLNATLTVAYTNIFPTGLLPFAPGELTAEQLVRLLNARRPLDQELMTSKRYWNSGDVSMNFSNVSGGNVSQTVYYPVMRAIPTIILTNGSVVNLNATPNSQASTSTSVEIYHAVTGTGNGFFSDTYTLNARL